MVDVWMEFTRCRSRVRVQGASIMHFVGCNTAALVALVWRKSHCLSYHDLKLWTNFCISVQECGYTDCKLNLWLFDEFYTVRPDFSLMESTTFHCVNADRISFTTISHNWKPNIQYIPSRWDANKPLLWLLHKNDGSGMLQLRQYHLKKQTYIKHNMAARPFNPQRHLSPLCWLPIKLRSAF
jgi:hypothetical protein